MQPASPSMQCEVCGAKVLHLRRGRCWVCYVRWAETRPVGVGASCVICHDRRRDNLRQVEFQGAWIPMCHNCGNKVMRLSPMPQTVEGIRQRLNRDRRWQDRRYGHPDHRMLRKERRMGERRCSAEELPEGSWMNADELIIEIVEVEPEHERGEATRISPENP